MQPDYSDELKPKGNLIPLERMANLVAAPGQRHYQKSHEKRCKVSSYGAYVKWGKDCEANLPPRPWPIGTKNQTTDRFFEKVKVFEETGCWLWQGATNNPDLKQAYGIFQMDKKKHGAHRAAWIMFRGEIPEGMLLCHKCDVKLCVNPDHLFVGTYSDNLEDAFKKGIRKRKNGL